MIAAEHPGIWPCTNAAYHSETDHVSSSALSVFIASRPLYAARYIHGTIPHPEPTSGMRLGSAVHARLLEPNDYAALVAVAPDVDRRTKAGKAEWQYFLDTAGDRIVIDAAAAATVEAIAAGIQANSFAVDLLGAAGRSEFAVRWELDGVPVKCRFDRLLDAGLVVDIKTTSDPSPEAFSRACHTWGYARQAWLYRTAAIELGAGSPVGSGAPEFLHLVCGTEPPHECHVYELDEQSLALGERQVRQALADLARCRETGDWSSPLSGRINTLSLPRWAFFDQR